MLPRAMGESRENHVGRELQIASDRVRLFNTRNMSDVTIASLPRIDRDQLAELLRKEPIDDPSCKLAVVDVRDGDYVGGHIRGCQNVPSNTLDHRTPELVRKLGEKDTVVFHCSLSQQRGPSAALRYLRERKRLLRIDTRDGDADGTGEKEKEGTAGAEQKVYVLEGGFSRWQEKYGEDVRLTEGYQKDVWEYGGY